MAGRGERPEPVGGLTAADDHDADIRLGLERLGKAHEHVQVVFQPESA